jgi:hypothetical protein
MFRDLFSREVANFGLLTLGSIHGVNTIIVVLSAEGSIGKGRCRASSYQAPKSRESTLKGGRKEEREGRGRGY